MRLVSAFAGHRTGCLIHLLSLKAHKRPACAVKLRKYSSRAREPMRPANSHGLHLCLETRLQCGTGLDCIDCRGPTFLLGLPVKTVAEMCSTACLLIVLA
jgi:hypothetical protein